ncbi:COR domain-containing protein [Spirosoma pomorum]
MNFQDNQVNDIIAKAKSSKSQYLDLSWLHLRDLPDELGELDFITELDLSHNSFSHIPSVLYKLHNLQKLNVSHNYLTIASGLGFPNPCLLPIREINISNNNFTEIPDDLFNLNDLEYVELGELIYGIPDVILEEGISALKNYTQEVRLSKTTDKIFEAKMIFVGQGEVGKTSLMRKLLNKHYKLVEGKEPTTHGININKWNVDISYSDDEIYDNYYSYGEGVNVLNDDYLFDDYDNAYKTATINIWDFGGQEIYYSTHQFFLTKRSIYIFVWDARREEEYRSFEYWFNTINILSESSPVIIVMNKSDVRTKHIDEKSLQKRFPNIKGFYQVSCLDDSGLNKLSIGIADTFKELPHLGDRLPKVWVDIRQELVSQDSNYITYDEYATICLIKGINKNRAKYLAEYFHDLGDILHYEHDQVLKNLVILNPDWATNAFYKLIDSKKIQRNDGQFSLEDLEEVWDKKQYPPAKHIELIRLMERFEICFNLLGTFKYIIPELLPTENDFDINKITKKTELKFDYEFKFMPAGLIPKFICRNFASIEKGKLWKNGVVLRFEESTALIIGNQIDRKIKIFVYGDDKESLLGIIRREFSIVLSSIKLIRDVDYFEMVPCICKICKNDEHPYFYKFSVLKLFQKNKRVTIDCHQSALEIPVVKLLRGYDSIREGDRTFEHLMIACSQLQGNYKIVDKKEDSRNSFISNVLSNRGLKVKDQTRWGSSPSGLSQGEIDIKVEDDNGIALSIIEGLNLYSLDTNKITSHVNKIFDYDPNGLENNYIISYVESKNFVDIWGKYIDVILNINYKYPLNRGFVDLSDTYSYGSHLKIGLTSYNINENTNNIYHIFIKMIH